MKDMFKLLNAVTNDLQQVASCNPGSFPNGGDADVFCYCGCPNDNGKHDGCCGWEWGVRNVDSGGDGSTCYGGDC